MSPSRLVMSCDIMIIHLKMMVNIGKNGLDFVILRVLITLVMSRFYY